jgi:ATP-dependent Clp protease adapter protein ClpS
MPITIERPSLDLAPPKTQSIPIWLLLLIGDKHKNKLMITPILNKIFPEFSEQQLDSIYTAAQRQGMGIIKEGPKEIIEHYYELCKNAELNVTMEPRM